MMLPRILGIISIMLRFITLPALVLFIIGVCCSIDTNNEAKLKSRRKELKNLLPPEHQPLKLILKKGIDIVDDGPQVSDSSRGFGILYKDKARVLLRYLK